MSDTNDAPLTRREKIGFRILVLMLRLVAPWKHEHQYRDLIKQIEAEFDQ